jgi:hypothetical protein
VHDDLSYKRNLVSIDPSLSEISGTGTLSFEAFTNVEVVMTTKDTGDNYYTTGGETIYVEIHNECILASDWSWPEVASAKQILASPIVAQLDDDGAGIYSYTYQLPLDGTVTIFLYHINTNGFEVILYENIDFTGASLTQSWTQIDKLFIDSDFPDGSRATSSGEFSCSIIPQTSETYTFYVYANDDASITISKLFIKSLTPKSPIKIFIV